MGQYFKTIAPLPQGVNANYRPSVIPPNTWTLLRQMRAHAGVIENFPGWLSILPVGQTVGGFGTLVGDFDRPVASQLILGGPNKVFRYDDALGSLIDISGANVFNATRDDVWFPFIYQDIFFLTQLVDGLFQYDGILPLALTSANAPKSKSGAALNDHICLLNTIDADGPHPRRFHWASEASLTSWVGTVTEDSGRFDLTDTPDSGVGLYRLVDKLYAYMDHNTYSIVFTGGNEVFTSRLELPGIGLLGPLSLSPFQTSHYGMGDNQFLHYDGGSLIDRTFGQPIVDLVYPRLHKTFKSRSRTQVLIDTEEIIFYYTTVGSTGDCDEAVVFNRRYNVWYGPFPVLASVVGVGSGGKTIFVDDVHDIVDTVPIIIDHYPGGRSGSVREVFITPGGDVMQIGLSQDANGEPITRILESGDHYLGNKASDENGREVMFATETVFMATALNVEIDNISGSGTFQVFIGSRMQLRDPIIYTGPFTVGISGAGEYRVPIRVTGRFFRLKVVIPDSKFISLAQYQWEFGNVGRR